MFFRRFLGVLVWVTLVAGTSQVSADEETRGVELILTLFGYDVGEADGVWDKKGEAALEQYVATYNAARKLYPNIMTEPVATKAFWGLVSSCISSDEELKKQQSQKTLEQHQKTCFAFSYQHFSRTKQTLLLSYLADNSESVRMQFQECGSNISPQTFAEMFVETAQIVRVPNIEAQWQVFPIFLQETMKADFISGSYCDTLRSLSGAKEANEFNQKAVIERTQRLAKHFNALSNGN